MAQPLNQQTAREALGQGLIHHPRPDGLAPGVVHLGLGGFHRAHQAMVFDELIAKGDTRWGVCAVGMRHPQLATQLQTQDHLYLVRVADAQGSCWHAPSSIVKTLVAANKRDAVVAQIANPQTRWITLTVTEKAYTAELASLIVDGLAARHSKGLPGLTIASCDNLPNNGQVLKALCLQAAQALNDPSLKSWIETKCRFPASMVDRIVPAPSAEVRAAVNHDLGLDDPTALGVEGFWEWVIEADFVDPADAQALRSVGVTVTDDVNGYEQAKLWMLNASHTVLASVGAVLGDRFIREVIARPLVHEFVHGYMTHASGPLVGRPNWQAYRDALLMRFANPMLDHAALQILSDSSAKIPVRWVPVGERLLATDGDKHGEQSHQGLALLAMAVAVFVRSLDPVTESGQAFVFNDPLADGLQALAKSQRADPGEVVRKLLGNPDTDHDPDPEPSLAIFGIMLGQNTSFVDDVTRHLARIHAVGVEAALKEFLA